MKSKLLILLLLFCFRLSGQVPNSETFTFQNVITELSGVGTQARVDRVTRNSTSGNTYISCNGYAEDIIWDTDATTTMSAFVAAHSGDFGAVTVFDNYNGSCDFIADVPGVDFTSAFIPVTYGTAENIVPNIGESSDLVNAFAKAITENYDSRYYPYYLVSGGNLFAHNSQLNFRNYGGTPDGIPIPVATDATYETPNYFNANWNSSVGATKYYIDVSDSYDFSTPVCDPEYYDKFDVGDVTTFQVLYCLETSGIYYYRIYAETLNGTSNCSNVITIDLPDPPPPEPPVALEETNNTYTSVDLNWEASDGATGYYLTIWVGTDIQVGYNLKNVGNVTTFHFTHSYTGLVVEYSYRVKAYNNYGTSSYSNTIYFLFNY